MSQAEKVAVDEVLIKFHATLTTPVPGGLLILMLDFLCRTHGNMSAHFAVARQLLCKSAFPIQFRNPRNPMI